MTARSFNEVTTGVRTRARSNSSVRRNSHNAGGSEVSLWRAHNTFPKTEHNARMRAADAFDFSRYPLSDGPPMTLLG